MIHLHTRSWFSFLAGGSSPESLAARASALGQPALALTDLHGVYGAVRFAQACKKAGVRPIFGATVMVRVPDLETASPVSRTKAQEKAPIQVTTPLVLLCQNRDGYANLCRLISAAHARSKDKPLLELSEFEELSDSLICLTGGPDSWVDRVAPTSQRCQTLGWLKALARLFPGALYVELASTGLESDRIRLDRLAKLAEQAELPTVLTNAVRFATPSDFPRYDALRCVGLGITVSDGHPERPTNDRAYLGTAEELSDQFGPFLRAVFLRACEQTQVIAWRCQLELLPEFITPPSADLPPGTDPNRYLRDLCAEGHRRRYRQGSLEQQDKARAQLEKELGVVEELELCEFFLVVREVTEFARQNRIRCAGRGSAANSIIAYVLGITAVDPLEHRLLFERFLHRGRKGMPDIDVDFDSERRPEVIAWMETRFGAEHCAMTATVQCYQTRGAVREMMKVLGFDPTLVDRISQTVGQWDNVDSFKAQRPAHAQLLGESPLLDALYKLVEGLRGCPRHLGLHSGGVLLTRDPLSRYSPIQTSAGGYRQVQCDKDDAEALGLIKFDVLGLRMLSVLSEAVKLLWEDCRKRVDLDGLPFDDEPTFKLIRSGATMSLFQIESPGQMQLLAHTQPRCFRDLVIQVALFRPGPLQGGMVNPYIQRSGTGNEPVRYLHPALEPILEDTRGIIVFQEQVLEICHHFAGLNLDDADEFRRLMSKWRDPGDMAAMGERFIESSLAHLGSQVDRAAAEEVFRQISAFVGYGFCRSHAAAFARTVYQSAYLKRHFPAAYMAAVLQHKPGFYPVSTVIEECKHLQVKLLPVAILKSGVGYRLESGAIRLPFTQVSGIQLESARALEGWQKEWAAQRRSVEIDEEFWTHLRERCALVTEQWETLARAGAFDGLADRRDALWRVGVERRSQSGTIYQKLGSTPRAQQMRRWASNGNSEGRRSPLRPDRIKSTPAAVQGTLDLGAGSLTQVPVPRLAWLDPELMVSWDFATTRLSITGHPLMNHRDKLKALRVLTMLELWNFPLTDYGSRDLPMGQRPSKSFRAPRGKTAPRASVAGWVVVRQRPPTAKGMAFVMLEDETGRMQVSIAPQVFEQYKGLVSGCSSLLVTGNVEGTPDGADDLGHHRSLMVDQVQSLELVVGARLFKADEALPSL